MDAFAKQENAARKSTVQHYPRMTALKSRWNIFRQKLMNGGLKLLQKKSAESADNPYLQGIFAPVGEAEILHPVVRGQIPLQLNGIFLRIGPNPVQVDSPSSYHWFSGDGMLHGLKLNQGRAEWFRSRYIGSDSVQKYLHKPVLPGYRRGPGDVVNTNVFYFAGKIWALIEAGTYPVQLDLELNSERHQLFSSDADLPFTAHPHVDASGKLHAVCYDALDLKHIYYEVFNPDGQLIHLAKIPVQRAPMIHDSAITEQDILIFDFPVTFSGKQILKGNSLPYEWNPAHQARVGVMPLYGEASELQWFNVAPCFVFHAANAYRNGQQQIVVDVVVHERMFDHSKQGPFERQDVHLERWILQPGHGNIQRQTLDVSAQEFPQMDERYRGKKHRFIYTAAFDSQNMHKANHLIIHDTEQQKKVHYDCGEDWICGEAIFIPESEQAAEGHGWLMFYVHHVLAKPSRVVILKVQGLQVELQAEIELGVAVPVGFHASWANLAIN